MVPVLYILMRTDLDSLNPGKAMAQAAHAANQFAFEFSGTEGLERWQAETGKGFGTTITLAVDGENDLNALTLLAEEYGYPNGITHDPSYPIVDGKVTHLIPLDTCAYIFSDTGPLDFLRKLSLHP